MPKEKYHHGDLKQALIQAGLDILREEGISGLSLRKAAKKAGVSHSAPYAHFADKQTLLAAISTEGMQLLHDRIKPVMEKYHTDPEQSLDEVAWAYVEFALEDPARFKLMFSSVVGEESLYPDFERSSRLTYSLLVTLVKTCQVGGVLRPGASDAIAVSLWSMVHGFISLHLEHQISHAVLDHFPLRELLKKSLDQMKCVKY